MAIEIDMQIHNKKRIAIMGGLLVLLGIYSLSDISGESSHEPYVAANASTNNKIPKSTSPDKNDKNAPAAPMEAGKLEQAVNINPFIEMKEFDPSVQNISDMTSINSYEDHAVASRSRPSNIPLPAIPNYNGRSYQERQQSAPAAAAPQQRQAGQPVTVQGVGTGSNGSNIAILSDGRVVSEGDSYNDGRIAYIGGDGITFDNGEKLQYK